MQTRANAYTFDGPIDPQTLVEMECTPVGMDRGAAVYNCNDNGMTLLKWLYNRTIVQFAYVINGEMHVFKLNNDGLYKQILPIVEVKTEKEI